MKSSITLKVHILQGKVFALNNFYNNYHLINGYFSFYMQVLTDLSSIIIYDVYMSDKNCKYKHISAFERYNIYYKVTNPPKR